MCADGRGDAVGVGQRDRVVERTRAHGAGGDGVAVEGGDQCELISARGAVVIGEQVPLLRWLVNAQVGVSMLVSHGIKRVVVWRLRHGVYVRTCLGRVFERGSNTCACLWLAGRSSLPDMLHLTIEPSGCSRGLVYGGKMYDVCVAYLMRQAGGVDCVLVGEKRRGLGSGKVVAPGGKLEPGETPQKAMIREIWEETGLEIPGAALEQVAVIEYTFPTKPEWNQRSFVFRSVAVEGEPSDSAELAAQWCPVGEMPYGRMWLDAKSWLPSVLDGRTGIHRAISFGADLATVSTNTDLTTGERDDDQ